MLLIYSSSSPSAMPRILHAAVLARDLLYRPTPPGLATDLGENTEDGCSCFGQWISISYCRPQRVV